jgi:hypothetical protein
MSRIDRKWRSIIRLTSVLAVCCAQIADFPGPPGERAKSDPKATFRFEERRTVGKREKAVLG